MPPPCTHLKICYSKVKVKRGGEQYGLWSLMGLPRVLFTSFIPKVICCMQTKFKFKWQVFWCY